MGFTYSVKLPGLKKSVWVKEINSKDYRDLIKSQYNNDESSFILHTNQVIEQIVPGILQEKLNVVDKLILLVNARSVSVGPDLKVNATCKETNQTFEYTIRLDSLFDKLSDVLYNNTVSYKNFCINFSIVKAKDEIYFLDNSPEKLYIFQIASSIDSIVTPEKTLCFANLTFEERCSIVENLPAHLNNNIIKILYETENKLAQNKLLFIQSPFSEIPAVDIPLSTDVTVLLQVCKLLFTDDLNNLYKLIYNLIYKLHFQGDYIDRLAPAELYLYWSLFLQEQNQNTNSTANPNNSHSFNGSEFALDS